MSVGQAVLWVQLLLTLLTLLGGVFALGRVFERLTGVHKTLEEVKIAMFGPDGKGGVFQRRAEALLMQQIADRDRDALRTLIDGLGERLAAVESRTLPE